MLIKSKPNKEFFKGFRKIIGNQLKTIRVNRGYSQEELAEIMNITRSTISKIENGKFSITVDYLAKFSWYLNFEFSIIPKHISD